MSGTTVVEAALRRDRWLVVSAVVVIVALCWGWIVPMARDMYGAMDGASAWMMTRDWDAWHLLLLFAMWQVMMAGMMLPSAAPTLLLYANVVRKSGDGASVPRRVYAFAAGYLLAWAAFSAVATILQRALSEVLLLSPMMQTQGRLAGAVLLVVAGVYQLTPFKRSCLDSCRSPAAFIATRWRRGAGGALRMGLDHGWFCVGCCWALMLLLFVVGVMNLSWIVAITIFVLLEKLAPAGAQGGRFSGIALILLGLVTAVRGLPF